MKDRLLHPSLVYPILGLVIVIVVALSGALYYVSNDSLDKVTSDAERTSIDTAAHVVRSHLDEETDRIEGLSLALKHSQRLIAGTAYYASAGDASPLEASMDGLFPGLRVDLFQVTDDAGEVIYAAHESGLIDEEAVILGLSGALQGTDWLVASSIGDTWVIRGIVPLLNDAEEVIGTAMVGTILDNDFLSTIADAIATNVDISLGSRDGGLFASSFSEGQKSLIDTGIMDQSFREEGEAFVVEYPESNEILRYEVVELAHPGMLAVVTGFDTTESQQTHKDNQSDTLLLTVIIGGAAVILGAALAFWIIRPLRSLRNRAEDSVRNLCGLELEREGGDEVRSLVSAFDAMAAVVQQYTEDLGTESQDKGKG